MVFDVFPFWVIYLYFMEFPLHIWILLQIAVILILHTYHFGKVVWTRSHPPGPSRCSKASVQKTDSRSGFSSKIQFIWYIKHVIWVTSNFSSLAFGKYFAVCDLIRTCTNMGICSNRCTQRVLKIPSPIPTWAPVYPTWIKAQALDQCGWANQIIPMIIWWWDNKDNYW